MRTAILLATYNGRRFLPEQLDSLMAQTVSDFCVYAHDDGSSDGTADLLREYAGRFPGRVEVLPGEPTGGARDNFWFLLSRVDAEVYFFCDQDDVWAPDKVERQRRALLEGPDGRALPGEVPRLVFSDMAVCAEDLSVIAGSFWAYIGRDPAALRLGRTLIDNPAAGTSMAFNRALREVAVGVDFDLSGVEMHDGFLLSMALLVGEVRRIDEPLVSYRQHGANEMGAAATEWWGRRALRNLRDLLSGELLAKKRAFLSLSRAAAGQLARIPGISGEDRKTLEGYARLSEMPKLKRIRFLRAHGFERGSLARTLYMYLWS